MVSRKANSRGRGKANRQAGALRKEENEAGRQGGVREGLRVVRREGRQAHTLALPGHKHQH